MSMGWLLLHAPARRQHATKLQLGSGCRLASCVGLCRVDVCELTWDMRISEEPGGIEMYTLE